MTRKLSRAAIETLAIIAYHQPVTRAEIEEVRGVGPQQGHAGPPVRAELDQADGPPPGARQTGHLGHLDFFLEHFGLPSLDDLPGQEELKAAGLLDPRATPIFRPEEPDLPLEPGEDETRSLWRPTRTTAKARKVPYSFCCRGFGRGAIIGDAERRSQSFGSIFTWVASAYGTG